MNILGLDASLTSTGYVLLRDNAIVTSGTFKPKLRGIERMMEMQDWLTTVNQDYQVNIAVMEGYAYMPKVMAYSFELAEFTGVIKMCLAQKSIPYFIVAPTTLKLFATGSGKSAKAEMMLKVFQRWDVELNNEHEIDAYSLAQIGNTIWQLKNNTIQQKTLPEYQRRAIKTVLKGGNNHGNINVESCWHEQSDKGCDINREVYPGR